MKYLYKFAKLPEDKELLQKINLSAERLSHKLQDLNLEKLSITELMIRYIKEKIENSLNTNLKKYSYHLAWVLNKSSVPMDEFVLIDHGGGTGLLGLLAKEYGIRTVIYNDISEEYTKDAKLIAEAIGNESDYYVAGDIDNLLEFIENNSLKPDAIISYNVLEHIYNIISFLKKLKLISSSNLTLFMSTGANKYNPFINKKLIKIQIRAEYGDEQSGMDGNVIPYRKIRKEIIHKFGIKLSENEQNLMTKCTRGMNELDIKNSIDIFYNTGKYPERLSHPTNTCCPYTGSWAEHLMNPYELKDILLKDGFNIKILAGYWGYPKSFINKVFGIILNCLIRTTNNKLLFLAPYWSIYGKKK